VKHLWLVVGKFSGLFVPLLFLETNNKNVSISQLSTENNENVGRVFAGIFVTDNW
jgi:hypothetical protein